MRRATQTSDSFELMLDAVCNAFGGIVLIAMFLVVITRNTISSKQEQLEKQLDQMKVVAERDRLQAEMKSLREQLDNLQRAAATLPDEIRDAWEDYRLLRQQEEELHAAAEALAETRNELQREIADTRQSVAELNREADQKKRQLEAKERELAAARRRATFSMPLPRERPLPGGGGIGIILRYDKMYIWHQYDASGNRAGLNTEEFFVVRESSDGIVVEPRPEKGMSISRDNRAAIIRRLKQCSNAKYLQIGLWTDTFDQWQVFREIIVGADYRYRLLLMKRGETIIDRGGTDAWAQ